MSRRDTCKYPGCTNPTRNRGDLQYPDDPDARTSNGDRFRVDGYGARFCSTRHELKYEHIEADARDAQASEYAEADTIEEYY